MKKKLKQTLYTMHHPYHEINKYDYNYDNITVRLWLTGKKFS